MKKIGLFVVMIFVTILIYSQDSNRAAVKYFFEQPFQSNILLPNIYYEYKNYDDLYSIIGTPLEITKLNAPQSYSMGEHTYELKYENYSIGIIYSESKDVIYIFFIWITLNENIDYTYNIRKDDTLTKIEEIFGKADYVSDLKNGILEYHYSYDNFGFGQLNIQLDNGMLRSMILWHWD